MTTSLSNVQPLFADHAEEDSEMIVLTNGLLNQVKRLMKAQGLDRQKQVERITNQITKRKAKIVDLLKKNPKQALRHILPANTLSSFPPEIRELLEVNVDFTGELTTSIINFNDGTTKVVYSFKNASEPNKVYEIYFADNAPILPSGSKVRIHANKIDTNVALVGGTTDVQPIAVTPNIVTGEQKTIVIPVNFQDKVLACSDADIASSFFTSANSVKNYFSESSYNNINITGDVAPRVTVPYKSTDSCPSFFAVTDAADQAVTALGINLNNYNRRVYELPKATCNYAGIATIGGNPSRALTYLCQTPSVVAHEFGHNLGWYHAATGTLTAPISEYGDTSCVMGSSSATGIRQPNTPHKIEAGWIPVGRVRTVIANQTESADHTYTIYNSENGNTSEVQALKFHKSDTNEDYYLSYRHPVGFDTVLASQYADKTSIHRWKGVPGNRTFFLQSLSDGMTFADPTNGIVVKQLSHDANVSVVSVDFSGGSQCNVFAPSVNIAPVSQSGSHGQQLSYTVSVTNNDSSICGNSVFNLTSSVPSGWSGQFSVNQLTLAPGASGSVNMNVTSKDTALDGVYTITVNAADLMNPTHVASATASYVIFVFGEVRGHVIDEKTKTPIAGARVTVMGKDEYNNRIAVRVMTDAQGNFKITNLPSPASKYSLKIRAQRGRASYQFQRELCVTSNDSSLGDIAGKLIRSENPAGYAGDNTVSGFYGIYQHNLTLSGKDSNGNPVKLKIISDKDGYFLFENVYSGQYKLKVLDAPVMGGFSIDVVVNSQDVDLGQLYR